MIWIARHGRTEANASGLLLGRADPRLDFEGKDQATRIASFLPAGARAISSPLQRCRETAAAFDPDHEVDERLIELDYGEFDLQPLSSISAETWAEWRADPDFAPPGGESLNQLRARVGAVLDDLSAEAMERDVVLFTHVSPIKASIAWALGVGAETSWRTFVAQASISRIAVTERGPSLHEFNNVSHLAKTT